MDSGNYSYIDAGFDPFLSRSIDNLNQTNLDSGGPASTQVRYDSAQLSGGIGDTFRVGNILFDGRSSTVTIKSPQDSAKVVINGVDRRIEIYDQKNSRVMIGGLPDSTFGWAVSKPDVDIENGFSTQ